VRLAIPRSYEESVTPVVQHADLRKCGEDTAAEYATTRKPKALGDTREAEGVGCRRRGSARPE
jgi:hypothetical protein